MPSSESTTLLCARCKKQFHVFAKFARKTSFCRSCLEHEAAGDVCLPQELTSEPSEIRIELAEKGFIDSNIQYQTRIDVHKPAIKIRKAQSLKQWMVRIVGVVMVILSLPWLVAVLDSSAPIHIIGLQSLFPLFLLIAGLVLAIAPPSNSVVVSCARCKHLFSILPNFASDKPYCRNCLAATAAGEPSSLVPQGLDTSVEHSLSQNSAMADRSNPFPDRIHTGKTPAKIKKPQTRKQIIVRCVGLLAMILSVVWLVISFRTSVKDVGVGAFVFIFPALLFIFGLMALVVGEFDLFELNSAVRMKNKRRLRIPFWW